jgi:phosphoribosylformimino-5-aminoimidazole carboxamide ribonucleotide (ProFAR) isomerase
VGDFDELRELRNSGVSSVILGEVLFNGSIDYQAALRLFDGVGAAGAA